jgi:hypothetical protein
MESSNAFELLGMVCFAAPFRKTEAGDDIVARFAFRSGAINVTGALLLRNKARSYRVALTSSRTERVFFETQVAREKLTRVAAAHHQDQCRIGAHGAALKKSQNRPVAKAPPQMPAQPDGV